MEELLELRELLLADRVSDALLLVEAMTEMSKDDKLNKIFSFSVVLSAAQTRGLLPNCGRTSGNPGICL